jgi:hypothetical protein
MKKMMAGLVAVALVSSAFAADVQKKAEKVPSVKSGKCSITLLDSDGIKPLAGAELKLQSTKDAKKVVKADANKAGVCVLKNIEEGRYVLSVNDKVLTLFDVAKDGDLAWCRIIVSDKPMLVGGQDAAGGAAGSGGEAAAGGFTFMGLSGNAAIAAAVAGGAVVAGGVGWGGYAIYDNNRSDDDDETPPGASQ